MKAMVLKKFGGIENFELKDIPEPVISENEVLVRVKAIDINPIDIKTRQGGGVASYYPEDMPIVLGWGVAGTIVRTGKKVENFISGDEVFGTILFPGRGGVYAEYVAVPAEQLARKPDNITPVAAAAATLAALTAWQALVNTGAVKKGDKVLVHGAAGGVGNYAVQIARYLGAYIVGTASGEDADFIRQLGADKVIDYKEQRFEELTSGFDLILDTIGGENFVRSLKVLKPEGMIILLPSNKIPEAEQAVREFQVKNYHHVLVHSNGEETRKIADLLTRGRMQVYMGETFSFEQLPEAHTALENRKIKRKIVVSISL